MKFCLIGNDKWFRGDECGGAEKQLALIALILAKRGHRVTFVVPGEEKSKYHRDRIRFLSGWEEGKGIPTIRYFTYRAPNLKRILIALEADLYYTRGSSIFAPIVVNAANRVCSTSLLGIASLGDLNWMELKTRLQSYSIIYQLIEYTKWKYFFQLGIKRASTVAVQNEEQFRVVSRYGLENIIVPNIFETDLSISSISDNKYDLVWIGSIDSRKGAQSLIEIVKELHEYKIGVIGRKTDSESNRIHDICSKYGNYEYLGKRPNSEVLGILASSKLHINTSISEGFPNTFLEAWYTKTPIVSLNANPDSLLSGDDALGVCANGSIGNMIYLIRNLMEDHGYRQTMANKGREYVIANHSPEKVAEIFEKQVR